MRKFELNVGVIVTAIVLAWSVCPVAHAGDGKAEISALEHKCAAATNADDLMKCYDNSNDLVVYDVIPPREYVGTKAVHDDFANFFSGVTNPKTEFVDLNVTADGTLGFARSIQHFTATSKDGKPMDLTFRVTDCLHKVKGQWKIIHEHISFPVDLATGKADMQSKP